MFTDVLIVGAGPTGLMLANRFPWLRIRFRADGHFEDLFERLDDTRFNLLLIGQLSGSSASIGCGGLLDVHSVPIDRDNSRELARASITGPASYLLRPDGHIGLAGTRFDEAVLRQWFAQAGSTGSLFVLREKARPMRTRSVKRVRAPTHVELFAGETHVPHHCSSGIGPCREIERGDASRSAQARRAASRETSPRAPTDKNVTAASYKAGSRCATRSCMRMRRLKSAKKRHGCECHDVCIPVIGSRRAEG